MVVARDLSVSIGARHIVEGVDLAVRRGEWVALIGPNGAGKSTCLRALAGVVDFTGDVFLDGVQTRRVSRRQLARQVAMVPQQPNIPAELTVAEYVLLGRTPHIGYFQNEGRADRLAAERAITRLGLRPFVARALRSLSGGELQRVVLARAIAQEAPVLLLDEPTSALDLGRQQLALELVDRLRRESGLAVVSAMHDLSLAGLFADHLLLIDHGRVVARGTAGEVLSEELIKAHYGVAAHVVHLDGAVYVLPSRQERPWAH
jgi:iron complex transport system ATP-binding protein